MEEELQESDKRGHEILENLPVGIALTDAKGLFIATNRAFQQLVGYTDEELHALSYLDITYEGDRPANSALRQELWEGKVPHFTHEERYRRHDGTLIWARNTVSIWYPRNAA